MIYFDNSATTNFKPLSVKINIISNLVKYNIANPGRSGHYLSRKMGNKVYRARENIAKIFNLSPFDVVFTSGCTESINIAIFGTVKNSGHIITTIYEHNSVLRCLKKIEIENKVEVTFVENENDIEKNIKDNTYMIITNHISNVNGHITDIKKVGEIAKKFNLLYLVDGAQSVGHVKINMRAMNINFLALAGHKGLHSISGTGALLINGCDIVLPMKYGGTGTESKNLIQPYSRPEGLEAGTVNLIGILAFEKGVKYTYKNFDKINFKIKKLTDYLFNQLKSMGDKIIIYSEHSTMGVVAFNVSNFDSYQVSNYLDEKYKICIRSGLHCAPIVHKYYNTLDIGMCRVSLDFKNTKRQIRKMLKALKKL